MTNIVTKNSFMINTSIVPWLSFKDVLKAIDFYKFAFGATESYRLDTPDGLIEKLSVGGAEF